MRKRYTITLLGAFVALGVASASVSLLLNKTKDLDYQAPASPFLIELPPSHAGQILVDQYLAALETQDDRQLHRVRVTTQEMGSQLLSEFEALLMAAGDDNELFTLLTLLGWIRDERSATVLERYLEGLQDSSDPNKQALMLVSFYSLAKTETPLGLSVLLNSMKQTEHPFMRLAGIRALGKMRRYTPESITQLQQIALSDKPNRKERELAIVSLDQIGNDDAVKAIQKIAKEEKHKSLQLFATQRLARRDKRLNRHVQGRSVAATEIKRAFASEEDPGRMHFSSTPHFIMPYFSNGDEYETTILSIESGYNDSIDVYFQYFPSVEEPIVTAVVDKIRVPPNKRIFIDLETMLGVEANRYGSMKIYAMAGDEAVLLKKSALRAWVSRPDVAHDGYVVPVLVPGPQTVGAFFDTHRDGKETYLELFNGHSAPVSIAIDFYEAGSDVVLTTYETTIPASRLELVSLGTLTPSFGSGTFSHNRPADTHGFFRVRNQQDGALPLELAIWAHVEHKVGGNRRDVYSVEVGEPDSVSGFESKLVRVQSDPSGAIISDTLITLVNTSDTDVTARLAFSDGAADHVVNKFLEPNKLLIFSLSSEGIKPAKGGEFSGKMSITFTGKNTSKVTAMEYILTDLQQSTADHIGIPLRKRP